MALAQPTVPSADDLQPGEMVGEYRVEEKIGAGGFGSVYRCVHPVIGKAAAVKVLTRALSADPEMVSRFVTEARAVNAIGHESIVDIFSFGSCPDGRFYFVMELLAGPSLFEVLAGEPALAPDDAVQILSAVAAALDAAHDVGIVHRDVKPENILVTRAPDGRPSAKLVDFGVAKLLDDRSLGMHKTSTGVPVGTPLYMSPEQCLGVSVDHRADIYSFGAVCFEVLTGRPPFTGRSFLELMNLHVKADRPRLSDWRPELGAQVDATVARMMAIVPDERPASAGEAIRELAASLRSSSRRAETARVEIGDADTQEDDGPSSAPAWPRRAPTPMEDARTLPIAATRSRAGDSLVTPAMAAVAGPETPPLTPDPLSVGPARARWPWLVAGLALFGVLAGGTMVRRGWLAQDAEPRPALSPPTEPSSATPDGPGSAPATVAAQPSEVTLEIRCPTPGAVAYLGDRKLGRVPGSFRLPRSNETVQVTVRASGYQDSTLQVALDQGAQLHVTLTAISARPADDPLVPKEFQKPTW